MSNAVPDLACVCSSCTRELEPGEPVLKARPAKGQAFELHCLSCCTPWSSTLADAICYACSRPLLLEVGLGPYCSPRCRKRASNVRALEREHAEKTLRVCEACGGSLGLIRSDAVFCSRACTQWAYRQRLAS